MSHYLLRPQARVCVPNVSMRQCPSLLSVSTEHWLTSIARLPAAPAKKALVIEQQPTKLMVVGLSPTGCEGALKSFLIIKYLK